MHYLGLLVLLLLMSGCSPGNPPDAVDRQAVQEPAAPRVPRSSPIEQRLDAPDTVPAGSITDLRIELLNRGDQPVEFLLTGGQPPAYDFQVLRADRSVVWTLRGDQPVPAIGFPATLSPGDTLRYAAKWNLRDEFGRPVPPGTYLVRGLVYTDLPLSWTPPEPLVVR